MCRSLVVVAALLAWSSAATAAGRHLHQLPPQAAAEQGLPIAQPLLPTPTATPSAAGLAAAEPAATDPAGAPLALAGGARPAVAAPADPGAPLTLAGPAVAAGGLTTPRQGSGRRPPRGGPPPGTTNCDPKDSEVIDGFASNNCRARQESVDYGYCMPELGSTCGNAANRPCSTCILLYEAVNTTRGTCVSAPNSLCTIKGTTSIQIASADSGKNHHWKLVPTIARRGVEDLSPNVSPPIDDLTPYDKLWRDGWEAVVARSLPWPTQPSPNFGTPAFAINSPYTRTAHQMHIHVAPVNTELYKNFPLIKKPNAFGDSWIDIGTKDHSGKMMCPRHGSTLRPFFHLRRAYENGDWKEANIWYHTTIAVIIPSFCTGASDSCDWCQLLFWNLGDKSVVSYPP